MQKRAICSVLLVCAVNAQAAIHTGTLSYSPPDPPDSGDGLAIQGHPSQWPAYNVSLSWTVTDQDNSYPGFPWKYTYTFQHSGSDAGVSHAIIETSSSFTALNMAGLTGASVSSIGLQTVASSNDFMPENMNGIRFDPIPSSPTMMTWTFWSNRQPMWGDFYARCGNKQNLGVNSAFNFNQPVSGGPLGFLDPDDNNLTMDDTDPTGPIAGGSLDFHILVPDTVVPEPSTLAALGLGGLGLLLRRR